MIRPIFNIAMVAVITAFFFLLWSWEEKSLGARLDADASCPIQVG